MQTTQPVVTDRAGRDHSPRTQGRAPSAVLPDERLIEIYEMMVLGRTLETRLHNMYRSGRLRGAVYPGVGQEAAMVGLVVPLQADDIFGGTHRDLTAQLVKGVPLEAVALNFLGKADGPTKSRDGNSHFGFLDVGSLMVVSPLPDAYPVAVGTALAAKLDGTTRVALANCGEGATATGTWHEAINFAAVLNLPVVFTIQNNQYAYSTPTSRETALTHFADRAGGYGIPGTVVDGNDVLACYDAAESAIQRARDGDGPSIIEAVTFRHYGHAGHDSADYVPDEVRARWMEQDPILRFGQVLTDGGILDEDHRDQIADKSARRVSDVLEWAANQSDPDPATVGDGIFAMRTDHPSRSTGPETNPDTDQVEVTMLDAIKSALGDEMDRDDRVIILGEDVGEFGGAFKVTEGLFDRFGPERVIDTPISEMALVGSAVGMALMGKRPVVELQYTDFIYPGLDQLVNEAAKYHWKTGRSIPMVIRGPSGAGLRAGPHHSISPEGLLVHHPGLKVVSPSDPYNAKGLLLAAIREPNPVIFLEHKKLYRSVKGQVPTGDYETPLGKARIVRSGSDVTIVAWAAMLHAALEAAERLATDDVSVEVVDLQSLYPLDWDTVFASVAKTGRLVVVQEDTSFASVASEVAAKVSGEMFWNLDAPIRRVTSPHTHVPYAAALEDAYVPQVRDIVDVVGALAVT